MNMPVAIGAGLQAGGIGAPIDTHHGSFSAGGKLWYVGGILVVSAVLPVFGGQATAAMRPLDLLAIVGGAGTIGALLLLVAAMRWRQTLVLHERGFVLTRLLRATVTVRAAEVIGAQHWSEGGSTLGSVVVELSNGRTVTAAYLERTDQIVAILRGWARPPTTPVFWQPHDGGV